MIKAIKAWIERQIEAADEREFKRVYNIVHGMLQEGHPPYVMIQALQIVCKGPKWAHSRRGGMAAIAQWEKDHEQK